MRHYTYRGVLLVVLLVLPATVLAQLRSVGPVPADLKMSYEELYQSDLQRAKDYTGGKVKGKEGLRRSSYYVNKMMVGGRIVYGDSVTRMMERIADTLLAGYPELRKELRFYTVLSPDVNAYATAQGMVFVNIGLVAQVEDEAQLAYVLSHEIIHYYRNHGLEELVGKGKSGDEVKQERDELNEFLRHHSRSREMEREADSLGLNMFYLNSPYAKDVDGVFDVLQYSALPFDNIPFDKTYLDAEYYHVPDNCWLDTVAAISSRDDYDDSRSTHPNLQKRRQAARRQLSGTSGGSRFVTIGSEEFARVQRMARMECVRQELLYAEYSRAFYEAYLLTCMDSTDREAYRMLAQALYSTAKYRNHNITDVTGDYKQVEGEVQQVYCMLRRIDSRQLTLLTIHKLWQLRHTGDYSDMIADLMHDLYSIHGMRVDDFRQETPTAVQDADTATTTDDKSLTKYERIKLKRTAQTEQNPAAYAFTDLMVDPRFTSMMHTEMHAAPLVESHTMDHYKAQLVYSPTYRVLDSHTEKVKADKSAKMEQTLAKQVTRVGKRFGMQSVDFSDRALQQMEGSEQYNDFVTINEWMGEFWQSRGAFPVIRLTQPDMDKLASRYGASLLNLTMAINSENLKPDLGRLGVWSLVVVPYLPTVIYSAIADREYTAVQTILVDVNQGKIVSRSEHDADYDDTKTLLGSAVYDAYRCGDISSRAATPEAAEKKLQQHVNGVEGHRLAATLGVAATITTPHVRPTCGLEFAINNNHSLALSYMHSLDNANNTDYHGTNFPGWTLNLAYRTYTQTQFAPLGHYWGIGGSLLNNAVDGKKSLGASIGFGRNYIFSSRILLNIDLRYTVTYTMHADFDYVQPLLKDIVMLNIGIGIL